ncbi:MAG: Planctomycete cytochrome, partial [Verrucomicrobiales bacterium]|nr:Planctomycete cytochrome [Verrucomicrobiales bacterium]
MNRSLPPLSFLFLTLAAPGVAQDLFAEKIVPILEKNCLSCHSHTSGKMKGGLTLDSKSGWSEGGTHGPAIIPGDTQKSLLLKMVHWSDEDHRMPPKQKLADDEIAALETWIQSGAPDPRAAIAKAKPTADWWSLKPLTSPASAPPTPPGPLPANPIDRFVAARLAASNLTPSPPADPRSLVRRLFIDLTGLPPSPEDLQDFLTKSAASPAAAETTYNELVDRLLASPRHGERWARHWLDTIHFADTHGFEHDVHRPHAWRFRDYVIKAFNSDTPWPRFIQEQLAADAFFPAETNLTAALGFLGAGPFDASAEGTAPAAFEYVDRDDLVTQTMGAFVSTTANCARCHAHKFDPITQEDYFALQAVFAGTGKGNLSYDEDPATAAARTRWTAVLTTASTPGPTQAAQLLTPENEAVLTAWEKDGGGRESWDELIPGIYTSAFGSILTKLPDNSILSSGPRPDVEVYTISLTGKVKDITALRLDLLTDDSLPMKGPGRLDNGNMHLSEFEAQVFRATGAAPEKITFSQAAADFDQAGYAAPAMLDGDPKTSWAIHPSVGVPHHAILKLSAPLTKTG